MHRSLARILRPKRTPCYALEHTHVERAPLATKLHTLCTSVKSHAPCTPRGLYLRAFPSRDPKTTSLSSIRHQLIILRKDLHLRRRYPRIVNDSFRLPIAEPCRFYCTTTGTHVLDKPRHLLTVYYVEVLMSWYRSPGTKSLNIQPKG